jgi:hypothetical protein
LKSTSKSKATFVRSDGTSNGTAITV